MGFRSLLANKPAMPVPQRFQRVLPIAVVAIACIFILGLLHTDRSDFAPLSVSRLLLGGKQDQEPLVAPEIPPEPPKPSRVPLPPGACSAEFDFIRRNEFGLTDKILYSRRCVQPRRSAAVDRDYIAKFYEPLISYKAEVDLTTCLHIDFPDCEPLVLDVPPPKPRKQYPQYLFGISTMYDRLESSLPAFAQWMGGTGVRLVGVVVDVDREEGKVYDFEAMEDKYRAAGISLRLFKPRDSELNVDQNHFTMIREILDNVGPETQWLGVLDDDTFFPSMYNLDEQLSKHDPSKPMWLGALSEDFRSVRAFGYMAFGGAGVFLSVPLAQQIVPHIDQCLEEASVTTGDCMLRDCVYTHSRAKLTLIPGLRQHDIHSDASGYYEGGPLPLSLHHWKSWYNEPVDKMAAVVDDCGDCFLQRFQFGSDTLLANGYSITQYSTDVDGLDLTCLEGTWSEPTHDFDWSIGPLRDRLGPDEKRSYRLKDAWRSASGELHQVYMFEGDKMTEMDEVIELIWDAR